MMIAPESFISQYENSTYEECISARNDLFRRICEFEEKERMGDRSGGEWQMLPSAEVKYQLNLSYLAALCSFMREKYNEEYVWGGRKLCDCN